MRRDLFIRISVLVLVFFFYSLNMEISVAETLSKNSPPVITSGPCGGSVFVPINYTKSVQFTAYDVDPDDTLSWVAYCISGEPGGYCGCEPDGFYGINQDGLFTFSPTAADDGCGYTFIIRAIDLSGEYDSCEVSFQTCGRLWMDVKVERVYDQIHGQHVFVDVIAEFSTLHILDFDYLIGFDASALTFVDAVAGYPFTDKGWEYFDYEYIPNSSCGDDCPTGLLRTIGVGDIEDGDNHPPEGYGFLPERVVLYTIEFLITGCSPESTQYVPINFYWQDCHDNKANIQTNPPDPSYLTALSDGVAHFDNNDPDYNPWIWVTNGNSGFPTFFGTQMYCLLDTSFSYPAQFINFLGGGIDIPAQNIICGDINVDCAINIFDIVYLIDYLYLEGPPPDSMELADVNNDSVVNVFDVTYLITYLYLEGTAPNCP